MVNIRCCTHDKESTYRGIDREVDMRVFNKEKSSAAYERALDQYLLYLSTEWKYTSKNLSILVSFSNFINQRYGNTEIILYSNNPIADVESYDFLGIDIVDSHLQSILKKSATFINKFLTTNRYGIYDNYADADAVVQYMKRRSTRYADLHCVYVYLYMA